MEFLDPRKQKQHMIRLFIGYALVATALVLTTIILLYQAYGFGLKNGQVIQNGLIFVSSRPNPADIYVNGKKHEEKTNTRLLMPAGQYTFRLEREGYRTWKRAITIEGGSVARFDYPVLFPAKLQSEAKKRYDSKPLVMTQSLDHRWLLVQDGVSFNEFDLFDTRSPEKDPTTIALPQELFDLSAGIHSWELAEWASDNKRVLLKHTTSQDATVSSEYILVSREKPAESVNVSRTLGAGLTKIELMDKKYDKFYAYNQAERTLASATLDEPALKPVLSNVLAFKTHGDDRVLYATSDGAREGKAAIKLLEDEKTYTIRQVAADSPYMLDIAQYEKAWYIVAGATSEDRTYVYRDPAHAQRSKPENPLVPVQVFKIDNPQHVAFSDNARFIMGQSGQQFAIYDAENDKGYAYASKAPMDAPQQHAAWMDGHRLMYVSEGKTYVADFDDANRESLVVSDPSYLPMFDRTYESLYTLAQQQNKAADGTTTTQFVLNTTPMLTEKDQ
jgi:hypothetical protein